MDISQVNTDKCNLEQYNDHEQIYLFNELYRKYNGKPKKQVVAKKALKESTEVKKDSNAEVAKKTPMDAKYKKNLSEGLHKKLYEANCNGDTHDQLAKEHGISKYMVSKLIKSAREERKANNCKVESEAVKEPEQKEEKEVQEVETTA